MIQKWATISDDEKYRYDLGRIWGDGDQQVVWVMLNPSDADAERDDMTVTKCTEFSKRWGFDALIVVNLYAYRSPYPEELLKVEDPFGPQNHTWIEHRFSDADLVVFGWGDSIKKVQPNGAWEKTLSRYNVEDIAERNGLTPMCLGKTQGGQPRHPSRIGYDTPLEVW